MKPQKQDRYMKEWAKCWRCKTIVGCENENREVVWITIFGLFTVPFCMKCAWRYDK